MDPKNLRHTDVSTGHDLPQLLQLLEGQLDKYLDDFRYMPYTAINAIDMKRADTK